MAQKKKMVKCVLHGEVLGYIVCRHLTQEGATRRHFLAATQESLGEALCDLGANHIVDELELACGPCAKAHGLVPS